MESSLGSVNRHFGKQLVELLDIFPGAEVLDIGVGKGACLFPAVEKVGAKGRVVGIDISQDALDITSSQLTERGIMTAQVLRMDGQHMSFDHARFDFVVGGFVLPFILAPGNNCLSPGIFQVLKKGGRIGLTTWERIEDEEWLAMYLRRHLPAEIFSGDLANFMKVTDTELEAILLNSGFQDVTCVRHEARFTHGTPTQWLKAMQNDPDYQAYFDQIKALGKGNFDAFVQDAFTDLQVKQQTDGIPYTISVYFVLGTK